MGVRERAILPNIRQRYMQQTFSKRSIDELSQCGRLMAALKFYDRGLSNKQIVTRQRQATINEILMQVRNEGVL